MVGNARVRAISKIFIRGTLENAAWPGESHGLVIYPPTAPDFGRIFLVRGEADGREASCACPRRTTIARDVDLDPGPRGARPAGGRPHLPARVRDVPRPPRSDDVHGRRGLRRDPLAHG